MTDQTPPQPRPEAPAPSPTFREFNPSGLDAVNEIKRRTDELIELVKAKAKDQRRAAIAVTNYEQAAMWAVKSLFE